MERETREQYLDKLSNNVYGKAVVSLLEDEKTNLDSVQDVQSLEDALGRKHAVNVVNRLIARLSVSRGDIKSDFNEYS